MDFSIASRGAEPSLKSSRPPLLPKIISSHQATLNHVRRKTSFFYRVDSSEEVPSPHDSIYEAFSMSPNNSDESSNRIGSWSKVVARALSNQKPSRAQGNNENNEEPPNATPTMLIPAIAMDDIEFLYGHGTPLETITEKKSSTTMSTISRRRSADDFPTIPFLQHRDSFVVAKNHRRKKSFSVNDLSPVKDSYHEACLFIESPVRLDSPITEIYAQPKTPIQEPPDRPETPPGVPSWTESQSLSSPRRENQAHMSRLRRIQRFLTFSNRKTVNTPSDVSFLDPTARNRIVSAPVFGRRAPRFRPPRSVYGPIDQHPFHGSLAKAGVSLRHDVPSNNGSLRTQANGVATRPPRKRRTNQRVRFTPSATARDSENLNLRAAIEATSTTALHPLTILQSASATTHTSSNNLQCQHYKGHKAERKSLKSLTNRSVNYLLYNPQAISLSDTRSLQRSPASISALSVGSERPVTPASNNSPDHSSPVYELNPDAALTMSLSSTAPLMTGALLPLFQSPIPHHEGSLNTLSTTSLIISSPTAETKQVNTSCWKCKVEHVFTIIEKWLAEGTSCFCYVCCGVDLHKDISVSSGVYGRHGGSAVSMGMNPYGGAVRVGSGGFARDGREIRGPRAVNLAKRGAVKR